MTRPSAIYLAAPLFNQRERRFNEELAELLEGYASVFLPQRDGELLVDLIDSGMPAGVAERRIFENDIKAMRSASLLVAVLDGGHIDEGVAFEIGFMNARGECCVGLQTDMRRALPFGNNPMIGQGLRKIFSDVKDLEDWVASWSAGRVEAGSRNAA